MEAFLSWFFEWIVQILIFIACVIAFIYFQHKAEIKREEENKRLQQIKNSEYERGKKDGETTGYFKGEEAGYRRGYINGRKDGFSEGRKYEKYQGNPPRDECEDEDFEEDE